VKKAASQSEFDKQTAVERDQMAILTAISLGVAVNKFHFVKIRVAATLVTAQYSLHHFPLHDYGPISDTALSNSKRSLP
jgi:hypothetical protein